MNSSRSNQERRNTGANIPAGKSSTEKNQMSSGLQSSQLMKLFHEELKDIYWAEKALTKALPKMIKNARTPQLIEALTNHLRETENQVDRCRQVFESMGHKATTKMCAAMEGLITESEDIMADCEEGPMRDAGIISACQKVEHYEISTYGTLRKIAETLGLNEAKRLLEKTLEEEKAADIKLTEIAVNVVNIRAREEETH